MELATIFILAITVEALVAYGGIIVSTVGKKITIEWKQIAAIIIAVLLAIGAGADLYKIIGVTFGVPYLGMILTGVIFSRGANYLADFLKLAQSKITTGN
jgi:hypothetical protein